MCAQILELIEVCLGVWRLDAAITWFLTHLRFRRRLCYRSCTPQKCLGYFMTLRSNLSPFAEQAICVENDSLLSQRCYILQDASCTALWEV